jgi:hypothetical protein
VEELSASASVAAFERVREHLVHVSSLSDHGMYSSYELTVRKFMHGPQGGQPLLLPGYKPRPLRASWSHLLYRVSMKFKFPFFPTLSVWQPSSNIIALH